ncbi:PadR family transcriptional regulator [Herbiconiux sp. CPCC 205763]|uniref:PadR family transcriptional regulator n=1 Tax=Herbiconiux aconitum TaxID=2970913 RepID=A0ABT2GVL3_9MICO|nr:PadR family transcriptional regulator [Herbiconiux aconitum]MCS5719597.1 PadR family transcriptional regulator [Herbiconiux aconitum]
MSIRSGILLVLCEADAYGLQIHGELEDRTDRRGRINVGQIYSTLDRLSSAGLVQASGATDDGLPLYGITPDGRRAAEEWLADTDVDSASAWTDLTFKVQLATSLGARSADLVDAYRQAWRRSLDTAVDDHSPASLARHRLAEAALGWLSDLESLPGGLEGLQRPLRNERPRRGRRPAPTPE